MRINYTGYSGVRLAAWTVDRTQKCDGAQASKEHVASLHRREQKIDTHMRAEAYFSSTAEDVKSRRRVCKTPKQTQISRIETAYEYYCGCMQIQNLLLFGAELLFRKHQDGVSPGVWKASRCSECDFKTMWLCCAIDDHVLGERKVEVVKQRGTTTHVSPDVHDLSKWWNNPGQLFTRALRVQSDWCRQRKRDTR